jgi:site-specific recombinase XerD
MFDLDCFPTLDPANRIHFERYLRHLELRQLKPNTIQSKLWRVYSFLKWYKFRDAKTVTQSVVEDFFLERRKNVSPFTLQGNMLELKLFYRFLLPKKEKDLFKNITLKTPRRYLPVDQLITREDISRIVEACEKPRDRALFMLMWDSGGRISELLSLNIGHVQFDRYGAVIIVNGKTGMRRLRLISSVPDLQMWLNLHPLRQDNNAPLFVTSRKYSGKMRRLDNRTVGNKLTHVAEALHITKPVHPHAIRHARLTDLARTSGGHQGLTEMELRLVAGWERNSAMPEVYVHLSGADVEKKLLEKAGIIDDETGKPETTLEPVKCPRCGLMNSHYSQYCTQCSMALNEKAAMKVDESVDKAKVSPDYQDLLDHIKSDLGLRS